jgi:hypothetical protein
VNEFRIALVVLEFQVLVDRSELARRSRDWLLVLDWCSGLLNFLDVLLTVFLLTLVRLCAVGDVGDRSCFSVRARNRCYGFPRGRCRECVLGLIISFESPVKELYAYTFAEHTVQL